METAVGIFPSREHCQNSVKTLLQRHVPADSIFLITHLDGQPEKFCRDLCAWAGLFVGVAAGMSIGAAVATILQFSQDWRALILCFGSAAILGLAVGDIGSVFGTLLFSDGKNFWFSSATENNPVERAFFFEALQAGHSLLVVRTQVHEIAQVANQVLEPWSSADPNCRSVPIHAAEMNEGELPL